MQIFQETQITKVTINRSLILSIAAFRSGVQSERTN